MAVHQTNQITVTLVVCFLGFIALASLAIVGAIVRYGTNVETTDIVLLSGYGTTALGGLIGLLGGTAVRQGTNGKKESNAQDNGHAEP